MTVIEAHPAAAPPPNPGSAQDRRALRGSVVQSPAVLGMLAALQAAAVGLFVVVIPVVLAWLLTPRAEAPWVSVGRVAGLLWLVGHGTDLSVAGGQVTLAPLGLTAVFAFCCAFFARRVATALRLVQRGSSRSRTAIAHVSFVGAYVVLAVVLATACGIPAVRPQAETAAFGSMVLSGIAAGAGLWSRGAWWRRRSVGEASARHLDWLRAALAGNAFLLAVAVLLIGGLVLIRYARVAALFDALQPGATGAVGLGLVQFAVLPNLAAWGTAWLAGPGFAVGAGTRITTATVELGPLPALPILGAIPDPGPLPGWLAAVGIGLVVLGGALGGRVLGLRHRRENTGLGEGLRDVLAAAGLAGVISGGLVAAGSGALGGATMREWGANGLLVGAAVAGQAGIGMLLTASVWPRFRLNRPGSAARTSTGRPKPPHGVAKAPSASRLRSSVAASIQRTTAKTTAKNAAELPKERRLSRWRRRVG